MSDKLLPCPCGKTPTELHLAESLSYKWGWASGNCCGEWNIEFRTVNNTLDSPETTEQAIKCWNDTPRAQPSDKLAQDVEQFLDANTEIFTHKDGATAAVDVRVLRPFLASLQPKQSTEELLENLMAAANAVIGRWESTDWKLDSTASYMAKLRQAIAALQGEKG